MVTITIRGESMAEPHERRERQHEPATPKATPDVRPAGSPRSQDELKSAAKDTGFGQRLRALRRRRGLTQQQLQDLSGVGRAYISVVEAGKILKPSSYHANALALALGVPPEYLTSGRSGTGTAVLYWPAEAAAAGDRIYRRYGLAGLNLAERLLAAAFTLGAELSQGAADAQPDGHVAGEREGDGEEADVPGADFPHGQPRSQRPADAEGRTESTGD